METILIQGAIPGELTGFKSLFKDGIEKEINGYYFYEVNYRNILLVFSITGVGIINAAIATMLAINNYSPNLVINQGTAGGHVPEIDYPDIVVGERVVYINNIETPEKGTGEGSDPLEWNMNNSFTFKYDTDENLVSIAKEVEYEGNLHVGTLGSGDLFSREADRINMLHGVLGELSEDMETAGTYKVCKTMEIPIIRIRIISNNELNKVFKYYETRDEAHLILNDYIMKFVDEILKSGMTN